MKDRQYTTKELFRRFQPYFKPYWKTLVLVLFCAGLTTLCELVLPMIMRYICNQDCLSSGRAFGSDNSGAWLHDLSGTAHLVDCVPLIMLAGVGHIMGAKIRTDHAPGRVSASASAARIPIIIIPSQTDHGTDYERSV